MATGGGVGGVGGVGGECWWNSVGAFVGGVVVVVVVRTDDLTDVLVQIRQ